MVRNLMAVVQIEHVVAAIETTLKDIVYMYLLLYI